MIISIIPFQISHLLCILTIFTYCYLKHDTLNKNVMVKMPNYAPKNVRISIGFLLFWLYLVYFVIFIVNLNYLIIFVIGSFYVIDTLMVH